MDSLPQALLPLAEYDQFVLWKLAPDTPKPRKVPVHPYTLEAIDPHDPGVWVSADEALRCAAMYGDEYGIGFVITENDPFFAGDVDGCLQPNNTWSPIATELMTTFNSAGIEISQSKTGIHIFGKYQGVAPDHAKKNTALGIELYTEKRFIALTGINAVGDASTDHTVALHHVIAKYFQSTVATTGMEWTCEPVAEWNGLTDDEALLAKAMASDGGAASVFGGKATFSQLWNADADALGASYPDEGGIRAYDASSADAALAQHLSFWTGKDCERIKRLMMMSGLVRDKWDRMDYMERTIMSAVSIGGKVYTGMPDVVEDMEDKKSGKISMGDFVSKFSLSQKELNKMVADEVDVMDGILFQGQVLSIVARPNGGKTLLAKTWASRMAKGGYNVFYIFEDADLKGYKAMVDAGARSGFSVMSSFVNVGTTAKDILEGMVGLVESGEDLSKSVFIMDTLKKFTEVLDKRSNKEFFSTLRHLTVKGATILLLSHANKYLDDKGNLVYEGTGDMLADIDAMYYLEDDGNKHAEVERFGTLVYEKGRAIGAVKKLSYRFDLKTYTAVKLGAIVDTRYMAVQNQMLVTNAHDVEFVQNILAGEEEPNQSRICSLICGETGMSKQHAIRLLHTLDGKAWKSRIGGTTNRAKYFSLLDAVERENFLNPLPIH